MFGANIHEKELTQRFIQGLYQGYLQLLDISLAYICDKVSLIW